MKKEITMRLCRDGRLRPYPVPATLEQQKADFHSNYTITPGPLPTPCWLWNKRRLPRGYGMLSADGKQLEATHLSWIIHKGPFPEGKYALHKCDNPPCVNPDHLFVGTQADNLRDMKAKGRQPPQFGENGGNVKLTEVKVLEIIRIRKETGITTRKLGKMFGVDKTTICGILNGKLWKHLHGKTKRPTEPEIPALRAGVACPHSPSES